MFAYDLHWGTGVKGELRTSMMFKELTSVVVRGLPAFDSTTVRSFSSSQVSIVSMIWMIMNLEKKKKLEKNN